MKSKTYTESTGVQFNLWDAFIDYLENIYFQGASDLLDNQTIAHEYESFKKCYA